MNIFEDFDDGIEINWDEPVYTSGVVCRLLKIPIWVLKQLDREQIITPRRERGRSRLYSKRELKHLKRVWYLMDQRGVKVKGLRVILEMEKGLFRLD